MELQSTKLETNMKIVSDILRVDKNFDLVYRVIEIGGKNACFYCMDGFTKDEILQRLMQFFLEIKPENMAKNAHDMSKQLMPYGEIDLKTNVSDMVKDVLSGITLLLVDGYDRAITIDCRTYPARSVEEPDKDKVMRGSRDGFVETLVFNTALIRRRIRNPNLTMEIFSVGESSQTDVVVSYISDRVDQEMLTNIRERISNIKIDSLTMNQESLAECLYHKKWYNPFPKFKFTERPDTASASLLEGNIIILVDNSPAAMVIPTSIFDMIEEADDYYFPPITGTYLRLSRLIINIAALLLTPTFLLFMNQPEWLPERLSFVGFQDNVNVSPFIQFLILEFAIDGLRLAALSTPSMLSTPLSVVAGIVLGDYTVNSGWFNSECMLYMAFVAIANYTQVSFELGYALKFMRIMLLFFVQLFGIYGYIGGIILVGVLIVKNKTISGKSYIYPLIPFNWRRLCRSFFRVSLPTSEKR
ncbi:MAG: spore germination protein [Lachnospiraceae bacterium]|nr:spore germination protein [Lachnospiraceae bacterium]